MNLLNLLLLPHLFQEHHLLQLLQHHLHHHLLLNLERLIHQIHLYFLEEGLLKVSSATLPLEYLGLFVAMSWMPMMFSFSQVVISASGVSLGKPPSRRV